MIKKLLIFSFFAVSVSISYAKDVTYSIGKRLDLDLSYTNPNYIYVDGDIITKITSLNDNLLSESSSSGGAILLVNTPYSFTFLIETKNGLVIPVESHSLDEKGSYINIISDSIKKNEEVQKWEKGNNYESDLVNIAVGIINGSDEFKSQRATTKNTPQFNIKGLDIKSTRIYAGNLSYIVEYQIKNTSQNIIALNESYFHIEKLKAVFFDNDNLSLSTGNTIKMYLIVSMEQ